MNTLLLSKLDLIKNDSEYFTTFNGQVKMTNSSKWRRKNIHRGLEKMVNYVRYVGRKLRFIYSVVEIRSNIS